MADDQFLGKTLDDLIVGLSQDIQAAADAVAQAAREPAAAPKGAVQSAGDKPPKSDVAFTFNAVSVDLKAAVGLEKLPKQEQPCLVAYPVGFRIKPEAQVVSSLQLSFAPLPRPPAAPSTVKVPDVGQKHWSSAIAVLQNSELILGKVAEKPIPGFPSGTVYSQRPDPGTEVPVGTPVDLVVVQAVTMAVVPKVVGMILKQAAEVIQSAGLRPGEVKEQASSKPPGTVLEQHPKAGEEVAPGSAVNLIVARRRG